MEDEIQNHMLEYYDISEIEYINVAYDIHDIYAITSELETNLKHK